MIERREYMALLKKWKDEQVIKVISGIRRCGKSTLLTEFCKYLQKTGVSAERIIYINFEDIENEMLLDYKALYSYIKERLSDEEMTYVFLDEIQAVPQFQKAVDSLFVKKNTDIYITGSNAYLLSGELATLLSGRYVEINMLPLSFGEYYELRAISDKEKAFSDYINFGGLPYIARLGDDTEKIDMYLEGIYNTIVIKDIEERQKRHYPDSGGRKVTDITLLKNISRFLAGNAGNLVSVKSISDYITSGGRKISQNTVSDYLQALIEPYVFYPSERYDVFGKQLLKTNQKMYLSDLGLRRCMVSKKQYDLGFSVENIVFLELKRRGYDVKTGKAGSSEIDFVARKNERICYYQVTASMLDEKTFDREMAPLREINDNYPKAVLTLDKLTSGNYDGIEVVNVIDWLLEPLK